MTKKAWWVLSLLLVLTGCGGSGMAAPKSPPPEAAAETGGGVSAQAGYPSAEPAATSASTPAQPGFSASDAPKSARTEAAPPAESRPGLGTEWGESRASRVHDVTFVRESGRPFAIATMNYNDRKGAASLARLHPESGRDISTGGGAVTIQIKDSSGSPFEALRTSDRTIVIGEAGQRYSIVLTNHTGHRFESVVTVDGLDVINGKPGTAENRGYVLLPFATLEIEGFRQSMNAVAAFRFASVGESYAAQTGTARNVGVIGVAFFGERGDTFESESETQLRDTASPFPADPRFAHPPRR